MNKDIFLCIIFQKANKLGENVKDIHYLSFHTLLKNGKDSSTSQVLEVHDKYRKAQYLKPRHVGGPTCQIPIEIGSTQGEALVICWLLAASLKCSGRNMAFKGRDS